MGDHSEPVMANPLGPSLAMMFVEMNAHFVGAQRGIPFKRRSQRGCLRPVARSCQRQEGLHIRSFVVEVNAFARGTEQVKVKVVEIVPCQ